MATKHYRPIEKEGEMAAFKSRQENMTELFYAFRGFLGKMAGCLFFCID
jgi:hypothetical protein